MPSTALFWLVAVALCAATVAALVWPLLRARGPRSDASDDSATTGVYRDQKRQLDAELAAGAITVEEHGVALRELSGRLAQELQAVEHAAAPASPARSAYVAALVVAAALPVTALALYAAFGNPDAMRVAASIDARAPMSHEQIEAMVERLAVRMKEQPDDPTGWRLLARAYSAMGRYDDAVAAFTQAAIHGPEDAALLADWADALAMKNQSLQGEPTRLVARALALDPNHPKAIALAASAAMDRHDYDAAIAQWKKLKTQFPPDGAEAKEIDAMIAEAGAARRGVPAAANAAASGASGSTSSAGAADAPAAITGSVSLDPKLRARAAANDTLFIYARAAQGSRMPLAIVRTTAGEWPRSFRLDDSMAMTPATKLSNASEVVVEARVSKTGNATPSPGDLQGASVAVKPGARDVLIVINDVVP
ncbi:MAG TPA: c-type cytochrome biogenesis protein CcmI [Casimicrobiaceae bacterium]|nr:c-type cytochrome biogenesis protein CcmI [Casimicrobiaceae bacterium]